MPVSNPLGYRPGCIMVTFNRTLSVAECRDIVAAQGHTTDERLAGFRIFMVAVPPGTERSWCARYRQLSGVTDADLNHGAHITETLDE